MKLYENERCDEVNDSLRLIQKIDGLTFGTDALLLAGYIKGRYNRGCEFGAGSGIITMLLLTRQKLSSAACIEVQPEYAELAERNAELNALTPRMSVLCADIREAKYEGEFDIIYTNPPYMKTDSGKGNIVGAKNIARHEVNGNIGDFCKNAARMLKFGGSFTVVYRPDRVCDLITAMRNARLEPKRMTFVHARCNSESSMVLIEAKHGGRCGTILTRPLIIYDGDGDKYSPDMEYIMQNGSFPEGFSR